MIDLNDETYMVFCMKYYETPYFIMSEFTSELKRPKYINMLFKKYKNSGILKERIILNHIILLSNSFGIEATTRILFFKIDESYYPMLKTFLIYLNYVEDKVAMIRGRDIYLSDYFLDNTIVQVLRNL